MISFLHLIRISSRTIADLRAMTSPLDHPVLKKMLPGMIQAMEAHPFIKEDALPNMGVERSTLARFLPKILEDLQTKTEYVTDVTTVTQLRDSWEAGEFLRTDLCNMLRRIPAHREDARTFRDELLADVKELDDANEQLAKAVIFIFLDINQQESLQK